MAAPVNAQPSESQRVSGFQRAFAGTPGELEDKEERGTWGSRPRHRGSLCKQVAWERDAQQRWGLHRPLLEFEERSRGRSYLDGERGDQFRSHDFAVKFS